MKGYRVALAAFVLLGLGAVGIQWLSMSAGLWGDQGQAHSVQVEASAWAHSDALNKLTSEFASLRGQLHDQSKKTDSRNAHGLEKNVEALTSEMAKIREQLASQSAGGVQAQAVTHIQATALPEPGAGSSFRRHRVYCMVPTIYAKHRMDRISGVVETWGKRCDVIKLFIDPPPPGEVFPEYFQVPGTDLRAEMVQVPLKRVNDDMSKDKQYGNSSCTQNGKPLPCRHIWEKVWRSWVYIADNDLDKADWFHKVDDDTFFHVDNLKAHIENQGWDPETPRYYGHVSYLAVTPFVNGALVGLSRSALRLVAAKYKTMPNEYGPRENFEHKRCVDRDGATQEITEAICLKQVGVLATPLVDPMGYSMVSLFRLSDQLFLRKKEGSKSWMWYKKPASQICCSHTPVAMHWYKAPAHMRKFENYLYNKTDTFISDQMLSRTLVDEVLAFPAKKRPALITDGTTIPNFVYYRELEYLFQVRYSIQGQLNELR